LLSTADNLDNQYGKEDMDGNKRLLASTLDTILKVYATRTNPDFLIPWQRKHQTSSGFVLDVPGISYCLMTNACRVRQRGAGAEEGGQREARGDS
jgi:hypothetical protein